MIKKISTNTHTFLVEEVKSKIITMLYSENLYYFQYTSDLTQETNQKMEVTIIMAMYNV